MIHARNDRFEFIPLAQGNANASSPAKVIIRIMSFNELEALSVPASEVSTTVRLFRALFVACEGIVDCDGVPLRTADAILNAPGLKGLVLECIKAFNEENGLTEAKKKA